MKKPLLIAIDGPAASGKGTLARKLSVHFGYDYLDTGKLYRAVALKLLELKGAFDRDAAIASAHALSVDDLTDPRLSEEQVGQMASQVAALPEVRAALLAFQRQFAQNPKGAVLDGRDIGTVICPDADIKLFIHATVASRAKRRYKELRQRGIEAIYERVVKELQERDARDTSRAAAPLVAAEDAITCDTTNMNADQVFQHVLQLIALR